MNDSKFWSWIFIYIGNIFLVKKMTNSFKSFIPDLSQGFPSNKPMSNTHRPKPTTAVQNVSWTPITNKQCELITQNETLTLGTERSGSSNRKSALGGCKIFHFPKWCTAKLNSFQMRGLHEVPAGCWGGEASFAYTQIPEHRRRWQLLQLPRQVL